MLTPQFLLPIHGELIIGLFAGDANYIKTGCERLVA